MPTLSIQYSLHPRALHVNDQQVRVLSKPYSACLVAVNWHHRDVWLPVAAEAGLGLSRDARGLLRYL